MILLTRRRLLAAASAVGAMILDPVAGSASESSPDWRRRLFRGGPGEAPFVHEHSEPPWRVIEANGIPAHEFGPFPNAGNPFAVRPQRHRFVVSAAPVPLAVPIPIRFVEFGVALNGVPFDPAGPFWNGDNRSGWQFEVMSATARRHLGLDDNDAHTQPGGAYHYHGVPQGYLRERGIGDEPGPRMVHLGYAADGFPIYWRWGHAVADDPTSPLVELASGYRLKSGPRVGGPGGRHDGTFVQDYEHVAEQGGLDVCGGRFGATPDWPDGTYHYILTTTFPWIPRFFRGQPHASFAGHGDGPGIDGVPPALRRFQG